MLESRSLFVGPWLASGPSERCPIIDGDDPARALGYAERRWRLAIRCLGLRCRPTIQLYETDDSSLICTAYIGTFGMWEVRDAECHIIGVGRRESNSHAMRISDSLGGSRAEVHCSTKNAYYRVVDPLGRELASAHGNGVDTTIEFDVALDVNPLFKMQVLLALIITH